MSGFINASNLGPYEPRDTRNLLSEVCDICLVFQFVFLAVIQAIWIRNSVFQISNLNINVLKWGKTLSEMDKVLFSAILVHEKEDN